MRGVKGKLKRALYVLGIGLAWVGLFSPAEAVIDRIVAIVNQEIITFSEIERWGRPFQDEIKTEDRLERRRRLEEVFRKILDRVIEERLIEQEARKSGIKVTRKEIETALEEVKQKNKVDQEGLERALAAEGLTLEGFRKELEKRILRTKFIHSVIKVEPRAGEKELSEFFQRNIDHYRVEESYRPAHIHFLIPQESTPEQVQRIRKRAEKVLERIREGADFGKMPKEYSEDASTRDHGGDLGFFKKGELLPALEKEAMRLKVGEVSGLIRTRLGFHILKLLDRKGGGAPSFEEIRERVKEDYYQREFERAVQELLSKLKEKATIEIRL